MHIKSHKYAQNIDADKTLDNNLRSVGCSKSASPEWIARRLVGDSEAVGRDRALSGGSGGIVNSTSATLYIKWVVAGTPKGGCSSNPNISENDH